MTSETFVHQDLLRFFCDKFVTMDKPFTCEICCCTMNSKHCYNGHKLLCNGAGHFGFKCQTHCKRFFYANGTLTSKQLKESHNCFDFSICKFCYKKKESDHICKLRWPKAIMSHNRLCFFNIIFNENENLDPYLALFYREEKERGNFTKYCFVNETPFGFSNETSEDYLSYNYFPSDLDVPNKDFLSLNRRKKRKSTEDFRRNSAKLSENRLRTKILKFILDENYRHTTFICNSSSNETILVSLVDHCYKFDALA